MDSIVESSTQITAAGTHGRKPADIWRLTVRGIQIAVDFSHQRVSVNEMPVPFSLRERAVFLFLVKHCGRLRTKEAIVKHVDPSIQNPDDRLADTWVMRVRQRLSRVDPTAGTMIETVWGLGYRIPSLDQ